ncbi:MAG: DUF1566 domain-containing protein, partial [Bacteroidetes bacterium]|nr:DUF1566 domain-containing protein [Bacteroidota bacterium]
DKGVLIPRLTTAQRLLINNPAIGLLVFDSNEGSFFFYDGIEWKNLSSGGQVWTQTGSNIHLADSTNKVGVGTSAPQNKLVVQGDATTGIDEAIFAVVSPAGDTLFAVYPEGTRVYVKDDPTKATGNRGGFAVGGFSLSKGTTTNEYLRITPDSVRIFVADDPALKASGNRGGFAVGGFSLSKGALTNEYLRVTPDSVRIYIEDTTGLKASGNRGGFAVGGFSLSKGINDSLFLFSDRTGFNVTYLSQTERDAIANPRISSIIFNTTDSCLQIFLGYWESIWCTPMGCIYPAVATQPVNDTAVGVPAMFACSANGSKIYYKWQETTDGGSTWKMLSNGGTSPVYSGCYSDTLIISNIPYNYLGYQYRCYVSNACGNEISSPAMLTNCYAPFITSQPVDDSIICLSNGESISFSLSATGGYLLYEWQESTDGGTVWNYVTDGGSNPAYSGAHTYNLIISNIPNYTGNKYRCIISNPCDSTISSVATINSGTQIGDDCGGGIVFYIDGSNYSYISKTSDEGNVVWGCDGTQIPGAEGSAVGTGEQNTIDIEAGCATAGIAADLCANLVYNGYDDWFLPSFDELYQLYLSKEIVGGFSANSYWSSTEVSSWSAYTRNFFTGLWTSVPKNNSVRVRCIRKD